MCVSHETQHTCILDDLSPLGMQAIQTYTDEVQRCDHDLDALSVQINRLKQARDRANRCIKQHIAAQHCHHCGASPCTDVLDEFNYVCYECHLYR